MAVTCEQANVKSDIGLSMAPELVDDVWSTGATNSSTLFSPRANFVLMNALFYLKEMKKFPVHWLLLFLRISSGTLAGLVCALAKWVLVGKKKEGETVMIWRKGIYMDTIWQAIRTMEGDYFMEMTTGSFLFGFWMNLMGSEIDRDEGAYVDSMGSVLNPEMVKVEGYGSVEREALLFGHIYEGEGGKVKFRKTEIREAGSVECRAVVMPGVMVDCEGSLGALSLAIKGKTIK